VVSYGGVVTMTGLDAVSGNRTGSLLTLLTELSGLITE
jgi:hypothetical protein